MKEQPHEEHENHERWLVSYADFITLLFAFFVVLYATSKVDNKRVNQVVQSVKFAMHFKGSGGLGEMPLFEGPPSEGGCATNMGQSRKAKAEELKAVDSMKKRIQKKLKRFLTEKATVSKVVSVETEGRKLIVRLSASHFFDSAQSAIRPEMIPVLDAISGELASSKRPIRVDGHTDTGTVSPGRFRDNWDLSASRAAAVASYVQNAHRVEGNLLSAAGHAATRPLRKELNEADREANRRIEMVVELSAGDIGEGFGR